MSSKSTDRLQGGSRVPVRGLSSLFKQLDPGSQNLLRDALVDAEDLVAAHNVTVPERQTRRKITGRIQTITLEAESNLLGAFLKWNRVNDKKVNQYELQVSNNNVFSDPDTFSVLENFFVLENIRAVAFVRVRAVTFNGDTGLWSNTVKIRPKISAPEAYSISFYQGYLGSDSDPRLARKFEYSGGDATLHAPFYTVLSDTFYADKELGGFSVWGYLSSRLKKFKDSERIPWDRVRFKVNGVVRTDAYIPFWTINYDEDNFHDGQRDPNNNLMSFYSKAGYTASFGPYAVTLPNTVEGFGPNDPHEVYNRPANDGSFYWTDAQNAARWSRFDEAQLNDIDDDTSHHEAYSFDIAENTKTDYLVFRDFKFNIPNDRVIIGIEAKIKKRQNNEFKNPLFPDRGNALIKMNFLEESDHVAGENPLNSNILEDVNFGRFVKFGPQSVRLTSELDGVPRGIPSGLINLTQFTYSFWVNRLKAPLGNSAITQPIRFRTFNSPQPPSQSISFNQPNVSTFPARVSFSFSRLNSSGASITVSQNMDNFLTQNNIWIHIAFTWNGNSVTVFKNGVPFTTVAANGGTFGSGESWISEIRGLTITDYGYSQVAIWDKALSVGEIQEIATNKARFRADLRQNFGDYKSAENLRHYWLLIPDQADIRDSRVHLVDETDTVRVDLDNKAVTDESWPRLSTFFYTDLRQFGILPLALSDGIPHDNHSAIGYEVYGGEDDLWGGSWTPDQINNFYFGLAFQAENIPSKGFPGKAYVDHAKLTVYTIPVVDRNVSVELEVAAASNFYDVREVYGALINVIELGQRLADDVDDC